MGEAGQKDRLIYFSLVYQIKQTKSLWPSPSLQTVLEIISAMLEQVLQAHF